MRLISLILIFIPSSRAFSQMKTEINRKQSEILGRIKSAPIVSIFGEYQQIIDGEQKKIPDSRQFCDIINKLN